MKSDIGSAIKASPEAVAEVPNIRAILEERAAQAMQRTLDRGWALDMMPRVAWREDADGGLTIEWAALAHETQHLCPSVLHGSRAVMDGLPVPTILRVLATGQPA